MNRGSKLAQANRLTEKREHAARELDAWKKRNAKYLNGWNPLEVLHTWRDKRWLSSTHQ